MVITTNVKLPEIDELTVPEVDLSTATLLSAGPYLGKCCESINNEFMLCRFECQDPRGCVDLGKAVTECTLAFFKSVRRNCCDEFKQYVNCIDKSSGDFALSKCRKTQAVFDGCMNEKMGIDRPEFGYFTRARIHLSPAKAPEPDPCTLCRKVYPDASPSLPDSAPRPPARFGSRFYWMTE